VAFAVNFRFADVLHPLTWYTFDWAHQIPRIFYKITNRLIILTKEKINDILMGKSIVLHISTFVFLFSFCQPREHNDADQGKPTLGKKVTIEDVDQGIRANIAARVKEGGGYFHFQKDSLELRLKLVRVHTEYLSVLGPNTFFACVDLATSGGDVYDVDFFLKGTPGDMEVTRTDVHKLNGKPYYTWKQAKDKTWHTVPVKNATNDLLGVIEGRDQFTFTYEAQLPEITGPAKMWLPIAQTDRFQTVEVLTIEAPGKQEVIEEKKYGNKILYLQLLPEHSERKITVH